MKQPANDQEMELMKEAYGMFFIIESKLRKIILTNIINTYVYSYLVKRYESDSIYYRNLIEYFRSLPEILPHFDNTELNKLAKLNLIRNKIAHSHLLTDSEFKQLEKCYQLVKRQPITKRKKTAKLITVQS
jgi:hypothetical protein